jgi:hypothetical protein
MLIPPYSTSKNSGCYSQLLLAPDAPETYPSSGKEMAWRKWQYVSMSVIMNTTGYD